MKYSVLLLALLITADASAQGTGAAVKASNAETTPSPFVLLHARPFVLQESYVHTWRKEQPAVRSGYVLVLQANLDLIVPRQTLEPVLYMGGETVERANSPVRDSGPTGQLVVLVPAPLNAQGQVDLDPWRSPTFFGTPMLAEDVDQAVITRELARSVRLGLPPARRPAGTGSALTQVRQPPALRLVNRRELDMAIARLDRVLFAPRGRAGEPVALARARPLSRSSAAPRCYPVRRISSSS